MLHFSFNISNGLYPHDFKPCSTQVDFVTAICFIHVKNEMTVAVT